MATLVLSAAGAAAGAAVGGNVLGLSSVVIGRAVGATVGRWIDGRIMGEGSEPVETGKVERFRLQGASEGAPIPRVWGRVRVAGQAIWATRFLETATTTGGGARGGGGKGGPPPAPEPVTTRYSYSVSLAVALCEGEIAGVGRVWADGQELRRDSLTMRVYRGTETQMPDPKIAAVQGADDAPAYRGIAYVVIEDLELGRFGNRVPQFSFEVLRPEQAGGGVPEIAQGTRAVALMPGTGEYALATAPVYYDHGPGSKRAANVNSESGKADLPTSLDALQAELPNCGAVSLIVSWFGDDLRCGSCALRPRVEQTAADGDRMPWSVSGLLRGSAGEVPKLDGRPVYGGTPADAAVMEAIAEMRGRGLHVTFYPFILMEQMAGNTLPDPWTGGTGQPALPWRGRITGARAPEVEGTPDRTAAAESEVAAFFGAAQAGDFAPGGGGVGYSGPAEWSYRRFILHYAHLCALAGGVDAFCIGSEMRALTQLRGAGDSFPAVAHLKALAADVRAILGPGVKIGYAADWSEYFGYHPAAQPGDLYFHLDPLWSDPNVDFIGIDNYMPLSDWRDGFDHADAHWGSIHDLDYLRANVAGGEGYHWFYRTPEAEKRQIRTPITDETHGEPWVWRYKDLRGWWENPHHERLGGVRSETPTGWQPMSKPFWFTELGCAAIDKGTNQPNKFLDPKSSESALPRHSTGARDELIQMQYLRAMSSYWGDAANNPVSPVYGGPMVDTARSHVWAWDARPYPFFPSNTALWTDGENYARGHWINGRTTSRALGGVVREICERAGVAAPDVSRLYGLVRGYTVAETSTARAALQPLMLAHGFDAVERGGRLTFRSRTGRVDRALEPERFAVHEELDGTLERTRAPEAETAGRLRLVFTEADGDFETCAEEAVMPDEATHSVSQSEMPLVLTRSEARAVVERWLAEARVARDSVRFALPPSGFGTMAGDVVAIPADQGAEHYRVDRVEQGAAQLVEAVRIDATLFARAHTPERTARLAPARAAAPVLPVFMDLPLLTGAEAPDAPHLAVAAEPWPGTVAVHASAQDAGYRLNTRVYGASVVGVTESALVAAAPGLLDRGPPLRVRLVSGALASASLDEVLNGANAAAIGSEETGLWEVFQFTGAALVGAGLWEITGRLRGQAGTDGVMPAEWPAGSRFVLLDGTPRQIALSAADRGLARHYRVGPAALAHDDPVYVHEVHAFDGAGLRPYGPAHLRAEETADGTVLVRWIRRTRIDGDSWEGWDVPLGEEREAYLVRVRAGGVTVREATVSTPEWSYAAAERAADGIAGAWEIAVAQVSDRYGPGPFTRREMNG